MKRLFHVYEYAVPLVLVPSTFALWWRTFDGAWLPISSAWLLPIIVGYVVPGVGTNILGLWEIHTRYRVGRFCPHHGFIFGSASSLLAWIVYWSPLVSVSDVLAYAFVLASTLALWNTLYDIVAVRCGYISVYNQPWADGKDPESIVLDYAPVYFGCFGFAYGTAIGVGALLANHGIAGTTAVFFFFFISTVCAILLPTVCYRSDSYRKHGHSGCHPVIKHD